MNQIIKYGSISAIPLYNCSAHTPEEWSQRDGVRRPVAGAIDLAYGVIVNIVYVPVLLVMLQKEHIRLSCFKIMVFLGIVDMLALGVNSIITGYLAIQGAVFCTYPTLIYCSGMTGLGLWCCSCMTALTLVINRLIDLTKPNLVQVFFGGYRTFFVLLITIIYGLYFVFFTTPVMFSSKYMTWFFDPLIFENMADKYENIPHGLNNILIVAITCLMYAFLCNVLTKKFKKIQAGISKSQKLVSSGFFKDIVRKIEIVTERSNILPIFYYLCNQSDCLTNLCSYELYRGSAMAHDVGTFFMAMWAWRSGCDLPLHESNYSEWFAELVGYQNESEVVEPQFRIILFRRLPALPMKTKQKQIIEVLLAGVPVLILQMVPSRLAPILYICGTQGSMKPIVTRPLVLP